MALTGWLDAMRLLYLIPARSGLPLGLLYDGYETPRYSKDVQANIAQGKCRHAIAHPIDFARKNAGRHAFYGMCLLMKPGVRMTAGNFALTDFGRR